MAAVIQINHRVCWDACLATQKNPVICRLTTLTVISVTPKMSCCSAPLNKMSSDKLVAFPARSSRALRHKIHGRDGMQLHECAWTVTNIYAHEGRGKKAIRVESDES